MVLVIIWIVATFACVFSIMLMRRDIEEETFGFGIFLMIVGMLILGMGQLSTYDSGKKSVGQIDNGQVCKVSAIEAGNHDHLIAACPNGELRVLTLDHKMDETPKVGDSITQTENGLKIVNQK